MNIIEIRRHLHMYPELSNKEFLTQNFIINYLKKLDCKIYTYKTSVIAYFDNQKKETFAFRCEEDGLPLLEDNDVTYASKNIGVMHGCGHDAHMAICLKLADYINENKNINKYNYALIFQPSEEVYGGSLLTLKNDFFKKHKINYLVALHLYPKFKRGVIFSNVGPFLSKCIEIDINIKGKNKHIAFNNFDQDVNQIGCKVVNDIYSYFSLKNNIRFTFGKIVSGNIRNITSSYFNAKGSLRLFDETKYKEYKKELLDMIKNQRNIKILFNDQYQTINNNQELFYKINRVYKIRKAPKQYIGEDFFAYQKSIKTCYFLLGTGEKNKNLHQSNFSFDEDLLSVGLNFFIKILEC